MSESDCCDGDSRDSDVGGSDVKDAAREFKFEAGKDLGVDSKLD